MNPYGWILLAVLALVAISALLFLWGAVSLERENQYEDLYKEIQNQIDYSFVGDYINSDYIAKKIFLRIERLEGLRWKNDEKTEVLWDNFYKKFGDYI